jgi:hypothetical protein
VLLAILDDLLRITHPGGWLILTGFTDAELPALLRLLPDAGVTGIDSWRCMAAAVKD